MCAASLPCASFKEFTIKGLACLVREASKAWSPEVKNWPHYFDSRYAIARKAIGPTPQAVTYGNSEVEQRMGGLWCATSYNDDICIDMRSSSLDKK